jgi:hypothetical protein
MVLKKVCAAILCMTLLAWGGLSIADEYRGDEVLSLNLATAVLSPKLLGPASQFTPGPLDVTVDRGGQITPAPVAADVTSSANTTQPKVRVAHARAEKPRAEKPRGAARTKLARRHGNPLDAQASDTRVQVWPCKSGGICNWQR